jgi:hypothetical protein
MDSWDNDSTSSKEKEFVQDGTPNVQQYQVQQQQLYHNQQSDQPEQQVAFARENRILSLKQRQQQQQEKHRQSRNSAQTPSKTELSTKRKRCDNPASRQKEQQSFKGNHLQKQLPHHKQHQSPPLKSQQHQVAFTPGTQSQFEVPQEEPRQDLALDGNRFTQFQHRAGVPLRAHTEDLQKQPPQYRQHQSPPLKLHQHQVAFTPGTQSQFEVPQEEPRQDLALDGNRFTQFQHRAGVPLRAHTEDLQKQPPQYQQHQSSPLKLQQHQVTFTPGEQSQFESSQEDPRQDLALDGSCFALGVPVGAQAEHAKEQKRPQSYHKQQQQQYLDEHYSHAKDKKKNSKRKPSGTSLCLSSNSSCHRTLIEETLQHFFLRIFYKLVGIFWIFLLVFAALSPH